MDLDFDNLIASVTKQFKQKADLEASIRQAEVKEKSMETEHGSLNRKIDYIAKMAPAMRSEVSSREVSVASKHERLKREKVALENLLVSNKEIESEVEKLKKSFENETILDESFVVEIKQKFKKLF